MKIDRKELDMLLEDKNKLTLFPINLGDSVISISIPFEFDKENKLMILGTLEKKSTEEYIKNLMKEEKPKVLPIFYTLKITKETKDEYELEMYNKRTKEVEELYNKMNNDLDNKNKRLSFLLNKRIQMEMYLNIMEKMR